VPIDYLVLPIAGSPKYLPCSASLCQSSKVKKTKQRVKGKRRKEKGKEKKESKMIVFSLWPLIDIPANSSG
jgi:hypothetical protein